MTLGVTAGYLIESIEALYPLRGEPLTMLLDEICTSRATFIAKVSDAAHAAAEVRRGVPQDGEVRRRGRSGQSACPDVPPARREEY